MLYKVAGTWGSHEGSLLLWILILAVFGAGVAWFGSNIPAETKARTLSVQAWISVGFLSFLLLTSNPFERVFPPGHGSRHAPAALVFRVCRLLHRVFLRRCGSYRGSRRSGLGQMGPAMDIGRLDQPDGGYRPRVLVGLL